MKESLVESVNQIIGIVGGPLLGLFLLGMLVPRTNTLGAMTGVLVGFISLGTLYATGSKISFMWYALVGCVITMVVGYLVSLFLPPPPDANLDGLVWQRRPKGEE
eukprot:gene4400-5493_t